MGYETSIEWTATTLDKPVMWRKQLTTFIPGATFNIVIGCDKVSEACKFCYAATLNHRWGGDNWGKKKPRKQMSEEYWKKPIAWNKECKALGITRKVFCSSMADVFEDHPDLIEPRMRLWELIKQTPHLTWLLLTKRPENIASFIPPIWDLTGFPNNVWLGTTVETQKWADIRIPHLLSHNCKVHFISCEPLLGRLYLDEYLYNRYQMGGTRAEHNKIDWVICGGESGSRQARPLHPLFAEYLRDQCLVAGVPFFFKQWGEYYTDCITLTDHKPFFKMYRDYQHFTQKLWVNKGDKCIDMLGQQLKCGGDFQTASYPVAIMNFVGKKKAGRTLDNLLYNEMPKI